MPTLSEKQRRIFGQLVQSMEWSRWKLQPFREKRMEFLRQYVGFQYSEDGHHDRVPINFLELAVNIYTRLLASAVPRSIVHTPHEMLRAGAFELEIALNHLLNEIAYGLSRQRWVKDALFSIGVMKVGITPGVAGEIEGFLHDSGQPFADPIDLSDWVHDMHATRYEQIQYAGNRYRLPTEFVIESDLFQNTDHLSPGATTRSPYNERGDERTESLSQGVDTHNAEEAVDTMDLWDVWIPRENILVTFEADDSGGISRLEPLRIVEWDGPEGGPYHVLAYNDVPHQVMPLSPMGLLVDLHDLANRLFNKLGRQAERQKTLTIVQSGAQEDGEAVRDAMDGQMVMSDRPEATREARYGGIDQVNLGFLFQLRELFVYFGGNLDALGGMGPQSETLGQDQLLTAAATQRIAHMQEVTAAADERVMRDLALYLWSDPLIDLPLVKQFPGIREEIPFRFNADTKEGDFLDYNIRIESTSIAKQTPAQKLQTIMSVMERLVLPLAPQMEQQGLAPDMHELLAIISKYSNTPELQRVLKFVDPSAGQPVDSPRETRKSPVSFRNYTRRSIPGASRHGRDQIMSQALFGGNPQQSERNSLVRPIG